MDISITIPLDEWAAAARLLPLIADDEQSNLGQVRLRSNGTMRQWSATDSFRAAFINIAASGPAGEAGISATMLRYAHTVADTSDEATLRIYELDGDPVLSLSGPGGSVELADLRYDYPTINEQVPADSDIDSTATVNAAQFHQAVVSAMATREVDGDGDDIEPPFFLGMYEGTFSIRVDWPETGPVRFGVAADGVTGKVGVQVNPRYLLSIIELFEPGDDITIKIPLYNSQPLVFVGDRATALLMPIKNETLVLKERVETLIEEVCGHLALVRDQDGDYPLQRRATPVFGRLLFDIDPVLLQVFAVVLSGIDASTELYAELNDLNSSSTFARLFHVGDQVLAEVDLVAATLDTDELRTAIRRIRDVAETIMPTLSAVLGGNLVEDPADIRLRSYRTAIIEAELMPAHLTELNGTDGIAEWPFPGSVHVLTGWNPQGVSLGERSHESINLAIAEDIIRKGGRFVHGHGRSPSGDHTEPSLIAWGLTRDEAITMGRKANQDSIFELDADEVRLISCIGDRVDSWVRLS